MSPDLWCCLYALGYFVGATLGGILMQAAGTKSAALIFAGIDVATVVADIAYMTCFCTAHYQDCSSDYQEEES